MKRKCPEQIVCFLRSIYNWDNRCHCPKCDPEVKDYTLQKSLNSLGWVVSPTEELQKALILRHIKPRRGRSSVHSTDTYFYNLVDIWKLNKAFAESDPKNGTTISPGMVIKPSEAAGFAAKESSEHIKKTILNKFGIDLSMPRTYG